jgi:hypothetical protein
VRLNRSGHELLLTCLPVTKSDSFKEWEDAQEAEDTEEEFPGFGTSQAGSEAESEAESEEIIPPSDEEEEAQPPSKKRKKKGSQGQGEEEIDYKAKYKLCKVKYYQEKDKVKELKAKVKELTGDLECSRKFEAKYRKMEAIVKGGTGDEYEFQLPPLSSIKRGDRQCPGCPKCFTNSYTLKKHYARWHSGRTRFQCPKCFKYFASKGTLDTHKNTAHMTASEEEAAIRDKKFWKCTDPECAQKKRHTFATKEAHTKHMNAFHDSINKINCTFCGKELNQPRYLKDHLRSCKRNPDRPKEKFPCNFCNLEFNSSKNRNKHQKHMHDWAK